MATDGFSDPRDVGDGLVFARSTDERVSYGDDELEPFIEDDLYADDDGEDGLMGYGGGGGAAVAERNDPYGIPQRQQRQQQQEEEEEAYNNNRGQGEMIGAHDDPYRTDPREWDPNPYQRGGGGGGGPFYEEQGRSPPGGGGGGEEWMPPRVVQGGAPDGVADDRWKKGTFTLSIEGSIEQFDLEGATISLEEEFGATQTFMDIAKSRDYLGGIKVVEGRNSHSVTIGVKTCILDDGKRNKIQGRHLCKGYNDFINFDMFKSSQFNSTTPKEIMARPRRVCQPILARYKNHRDPAMHMFANPDNLREKIVVDPSDTDGRKMIVPRIHPVAKELIKRARRRCVQAGRPFIPQHEGFELSAGQNNFVIGSKDVEAMQEDLTRDFNRTMYVSDLAGLTVTFLRTQISRPTELKNKLKTNWTDTREISAGLNLGTASGDEQLNQRLARENQIILTFEYEYLPHRLASSVPQQQHHQYY